MISECEFRAYAKGAAYFSIGFCFPYVILSSYIKKRNPRLFRYAILVPTLIAFHTLTYIPRDLERCRAIEEAKRKKQLWEGSSSV